MVDCNPEMLNMLTQQIRTIINPLIQETHSSYLALSNQMGRIADFLGAPRAHNTPLPQNQNPRHVEMSVGRPNNGIPANPLQQPVVEPRVPRVQERIPIVVQRNQDADHIVRRAKQNNLEGQNNLGNIVETLLTQNGFNMGLHRPNFVSALSEYMLMEELPRGWKVPKFIKFSGETNESTVEHISRYLTVAGDIANNVNMRIKYFPCSLTKNAFTWFTMLPPRFHFHLESIRKGFP